MGGSDGPGSYKWLVLLASFMLQLLLSSVLAAVGVFYMIFIQNLGGSSSLISLASSMCIAVSFAIGPVVGYLINMYGCRTVAISGSIIATLGLSLTAFVTCPGHLFITFGLLQGLGIGAIYFAAVVAVGQYFSKRRPLAMGIAITGIGVGPIISPPVFTLFEKHYGWRGAILLYSGIFLHTMLFSMLLKPVKIGCQHKDYANADIPTAPYEKHNQKDTKPHEAGECGKSSRMLLTNTAFVINLIQTILFSVGLCIIQVHIAAFAVSMGISTDHAAMLIFTMGIGSACSRVFFGILLQLLALDPVKVYMATSLILGTLSIAYPFANSYGSLVAIAGFLGFFAASYGSLPPLIAIKLVGIEHFALSYGYVGFASAVGYIIGGPLSGWIYEASLNYQIVFFVSGGMVIMSVVTLVLISIVQKHEQPIFDFQTESKTI